ncbi:mCG14699, isoform CRA_a [Mus musculus]|nr:mCG14699, isoform CRA_a [Mus musculus]
MDRVTTAIPRYLGATQCSQSPHLHLILLPATPLHSRLVTIRAVTLSRTPMGSRAAMDNRVAMADVEDLGKWIKASTVRNAETGPTRDLQSCIDDQIYFLNQKMF